MKVNIESLHFDADKKLLTFVQSHVEKLIHFYESINGAEVILRLDNSSDTENKVVEIKLLIKGHDLFAKKQCKSFEEACDSAVEALKSQVIKHKEKVNSHKVKAELIEE